MITKERINNANKIYKNMIGWKFARESITDYFNKNKDNINKKIVLIKVLLIDSLYKTQLKEPILVAEHIYSLKDLDKKLENGDLTAIENIRNWKIDILSFASKFCHFHNKESYPLYDKYVCKALENLIGYKDKRDYQRFINTIKEVFKDNFKDFEESDTFLWIYGQKLALENGEKRISKEIKELYEKNRELFEAL